MDTDELSTETYDAILVEAERFDHNLTLHLGVLSYDCEKEQEFIEKAEQLLHSLRKAESNELINMFFGELQDMNMFHQTIDKILRNLEEVKEIPFEKRRFEF